MFTKIDLRHWYFDVSKVIWKYVFGYHQISQKLFGPEPFAEHYALIIFTLAELTLVRIYSNSFGSLPALSPTTAAL